MGGGHRLTGALQYFGALPHQTQQLHRKAPAYTVQPAGPPPGGLYMGPYMAHIWAVYRPLYGPYITHI